MTFYCTDDWSAAPAYEPWWPAYREAYSRVRERQHAVVAVSEPIIERVAPTGVHRVVPNGISVAEWVTPGRPPEWLSDLPRPLAVYVGTLESRLDADAVAAITRSLDGGTLLLAGPVFDARHVATIASIPGVVIRGPVDRGELPALVSAADVCVVPHTRTRFTEAMSPLKAYEYLAGGKPVVATDLVPLRGIHDHVLLAPDAPAFESATTEALRLGPLDESARESFVAANSWDVRHRELLNVVLRDPRRPE